MAKYEWSPGYRVSIPPNVVGAEIQAACKEGGHLEEAEAVLERAKAKDNPIHGFFEWNDKVAGHQYRLEQARYLIRGLVITEDDDGNRVPRVKAYEGVQGGGWVSTVMAAKSDTGRTFLLQKAEQELRQWQARYGALKELCKVSKRIDFVIRWFKKVGFSKRKSVEPVNPKADAMAKGSEAAT